MLALTFQNSADYDKISGSDKISILGLKDFAPGKPLDVEITHKDGSKDHIKVNHSFNAGQIEFFKAGFALNLIFARLVTTRRSAHPRGIYIARDVTSKKSA